MIAVPSCVAAPPASEHVAATEKFVGPWWLLLLKPAIVAIGTGLLLTGSTHSPSDATVIIDKPHSSRILDHEREREQESGVKYDDNSPCYPAQRTLWLEVSSVDPLFSSPNAPVLDLPLVTMIAASRDPTFAETTVRAACSARQRALFEMLKTPKLRLEALNGVVRYYFGHISASSNSANTDRWVNRLSDPGVTAGLRARCRSEGLAVGSDTLAAQAYCVGAERVKEVWQTPVYQSHDLRALVRRIYRGAM